MIDGKEIWMLKPSREGQTIGGKALFGATLTQAEIQRYKNQGYAHWFMLKPQPANAETGPKTGPEEPVKEESGARNKAKPSGIEKLDIPPQE